MIGGWINFFTIVRRKMRRSHVVEEYPGAYHFTLPSGQQAPYGKTIKVLIFWSD